MGGHGHVLAVVGSNEWSKVDHAKRGWVMGGHPFAVVGGVMGGPSLETATSN